VKDLDNAGPSGYCVPPHIRRDHPMLEALAPYGSKTAREFFDDYDRWIGGATID
jgi:hypothetical protein